MLPNRCFASLGCGGVPGLGQCRAVVADLKEEEVQHAEEHRHQENRVPPAGATYCCTPGCRRTDDRATRRGP